MGQIEKQRKAWEAGKEFMGELDVTPWDALLSEVRRSAYRSAWVDHRVEKARKQVDSEEVSGNAEVQLVYDAELRKWLEESRRERAHMTRISKQAIDAGLAERYVESIRAEGTRIIGIIARTMEAAQLEPHQVELAKAALEVELTEASREMRAKAQLVQLPQFE